MKHLAFSLCLLLCVSLLHPMAVLAQRSNFTYTILAQTGQGGLLSIAADTGINDAGKVAFIGSINDANTHTPVENLFVGTASNTFTNISPKITNKSYSEQFSPGLQINNYDQV